MTFAPTSFSAEQGIASAIFVVSSVSAALRTPTAVPSASMTGEPLYPIEIRPPVGRILDLNAAIGASVSNLSIRKLAFVPSFGISEASELGVHHVFSVPKLERQHSRWRARGNREKGYVYRQGAGRPRNLHYSLYLCFGEVEADGGLATHQIGFIVSRHSKSLSDDMCARAHESISCKETSPNDVTVGFPNRADGCFAR